MSRAVFALAVAALAAGSAIWLVTTTAGIDAHETLDRALYSDYEVDYTGEVEVYERQTRTAHYLIAHQHPNLDCIRYEGSSEPGLLVVSGSHSAVCLDGGNGGGFSLPNGAMTSPEATSQLIRSNYRVKILGNEVVADRPAVRMRVTPRRGTAVVRELWIDAEKYLVLRLRELDRMGRELSDKRFARVSFDPVALGELVGDYEMSADTAVALAEEMSPAELSQRLGFTVSAPERIPKGYVLVGTYLTECPGGYGAEAALYRYTDGLSGISVFETRQQGGGLSLDGTSARSVAEGQCLITRRGRETVAVVQKSDLYVIAVGNLPANVLAAVADTVPFGEKPTSG